MSSDGISMNHHPNRNMYDEMQCPKKITAYATDREVHFSNREFNPAKGKNTSHECDWPVIPSYTKGN